MNNENEEQEAIIQMQAFGSIAEILISFVCVVQGENSQANKQHKKIEIVCLQPSIQLTQMSQSQIDQAQAGQSTYTVSL